MRLNFSFGVGSPIGLGMKLVQFFLILFFLGCGLIFQNCGRPFITHLNLQNEKSASLLPALPGPFPAPTPGFDLTFLATDPKLFHQVGEIQNSAMVVQISKDSPGKFLNYGPYVELPAGYKKVTFDLELNTANTGVNAQKIFSLDIYDSTQSKVITAKDFWLEDLQARDHEYALVFKAEANNKYEFRITWLGGADLKFKKIRVTNADFGKYGDLFDLKATFKKVASLPGGNGWIVIDGGVWYHFDRLLTWKPNIPTHCLFRELTLSIIVRESHDKGQTWSAGKAAIQPSLNAADVDSCFVVDGTTFFDPPSARWLTFSQCLGGQNSQWKMCLYESMNVDGPYTKRDIHFQPGQIWKLICAGSGKACPQNVFDEGTPDYLYFLRGWHYLTFHGYDGKKGYRGMARTKDFINWQVEGPELAGDALLTDADCKAWNPGCIGAGHASSLRSGDFVYMLWEGPTLNLACSADQYWPFGFSRSHQYERSGHWENGPVNPYLAPISNYGCGTQYARFVPDGNDLYMFYDYAEMKGEQRIERYNLYKLTRNTNDSTPLAYMGADNLLKHQVGAISDSAWESSPSELGFLSYGPYSTAWGNGYRQVSFNLSAKNINLASTKIAVAKIDLFDATTGKMIVEKIIFENEFLFGELNNNFSLPIPFENYVDHSLEARVYVYGNRSVKLNAINVN